MAQENRALTIFPQPKMLQWRYALVLLVLLPLAACEKNETLNSGTGPTAVLVDPSMAPSMMPAPTPVVQNLPTSSAPTDVLLDPNDQPSYAPSILPSAPPTLTRSSAPTLSVQPSPAPTLTPTDSPTFYPTDSPEPSPSPSMIPSAPPSDRPSSLPTDAPTETMIPSPSPSAVPTQSPSSSPTVLVPSSMPTEESSGTPSMSMMPSIAPTETAVLPHGPTTSPSALHSSLPTISLQPTALYSEWPSISWGPSRMPTNFPTLSHSTSPTTSSAPSVSPTLQPSGGPTARPTVQSSDAPTVMPSFSPSARPSVSPSSVPSGSPSVHPTGASSLSPSLQPTKSPSASPSSQPSTVPSASPSRAPSVSPSVRPSDRPSTYPSYQPSMVSSVSPTDDPTVSPSHQPSAAPSETPANLPTSMPTSSTERVALTSVSFTASQLMDVGTEAVFESTTLNFIRANIEQSSDFLITIASVLVTEQTLEGTRRLGQIQPSASRGLQTSQLKIEMKIAGDVWQRSQKDIGNVLFDDIVTKPLTEKYSEYLNELSGASDFFDDGVQPSASSLESPLTSSSSKLEGPALVGMIVGLSVVAVGVIGFVIWRLRRESGSYHDANDEWRVRGSMESEDSLSISTKDSVGQPLYRSSYRDMASPTDSEMYLKSNRSLQASNRSFQVSDRDLKVSQVDSPSTASATREPEGTTYAEIMKATEKYAQMLSDGRSEATDSIVMPGNEDKYLSLHSEAYRPSPLAPIGENEAASAATKHGNDDSVQMRTFSALSPTSTGHRKQTPKQARLEDCEVQTPKGGFVTNQATPKGTQFVQLDTRSARSTGGILDDLTDMESVWEGKLDSKVNAVAETPRVNNLQRFHRPPKESLYYKRSQEYRPDP